MHVLHLSGIITLGNLKTGVEYRLVFRNSLHIACIKQFPKESVKLNTGRQ